MGRPPSVGPGSARALLLFSEYVEKPLKLVLKVGGSEVTELSTGSSGHDSSLFEDRSDHDKHKDRKRKKRKKGEKQAPGEEKGRKRRRVKVTMWLALLLRAPAPAPSLLILGPVGTPRCLGSVALWRTNQKPGSPGRAASCRNYPLEHLSPHILEAVESWSSVASSKAVF